MKNWALFFVLFCTLSSLYAQENSVGWDEFGPKLVLEVSGGQTLLSPMLRNKTFSPSFHLGAGLEWQEQFVSVTQIGYTKNVGELNDTYQQFAETWFVRSRVYISANNDANGGRFWLHGGLYYGTKEEWSDISIASTYYDDLDTRLVHSSRTALVATGGVAFTLDVSPHISLVLDTNLLAIPLLDDALFDGDIIIGSTEVWYYMQGLGAYRSPWALQFDAALRFRLPL